MSALLLAVSLVLPASADLDTDSVAWDGASYMATTATEAHVRISIHTELDWTVVGKERVLFVLNPSDDSGTDSLLRFLEHGGHAVIIFDQAYGAPRLLKALGLEPVKSALDHDTYYEQHPAFPVIRPTDIERETFLWFNVESIVANHPLVLSIANKADGLVAPLITFRESTQILAAEVAVGRGKALVIGDSSVVINDMQKHLYGDKQFLANLFRYYCDSNNDCIVDVVVPSATHIGTWRPTIPSGLFGIQYLLDRGIDSLEAGITGLLRWCTTPEGLIFLLATMAMVLAGLYLFLPWHSRRALPQWLIQLAPQLQMTDFWVAALSRRRHGASFFRPVCVLLADIEDALSRKSPDKPLHALDDNERVSLAQRLAAEDDGPPIGASLRCLEALHKVRKAELAEIAPFIGLQEFEELWKNAHIVLKSQR